MFEGPRRVINGKVVTEWLKWFKSCRAGLNTVKGNERNV